MNFQANSDINTGMLSVLPATAINFVSDICDDHMRQGWQDLKLIDNYIDGLKDEKA